METETTRRQISTGICGSCGAELAKNKMTQHLKSCKERLATIAAQEEKSRKAKTRLFHILAEGQYNPQYWLHFEVPASESLWWIDRFLKDMWIDDLDHLSGFTINGTNYSVDYPDEYFSFGEAGEEEENEEEMSEEEEEKELRELIDSTVSEFAGGAASFLGTPVNPLSAEWIAELKKPRSVDELVDFLKEELARITKEDKTALKNDNDRDISLEEKRKRYFNLYYQKLIVRDLLEAVEDRSMDVSLGRVLKVGQKFSWVYDYGSSTYINLRVIAEREGIVQNKKKPVQLLARNSAPAFPCVVCGKPATTVAMGYYTYIEDSVFCTSCAKKQDEEGGMLPIINSPRVGVL